MEIPWLYISIEDITTVLNIVKTVIPNLFEDLFSYHILFQLFL